MPDDETPDSLTSNESPEDEADIWIPEPDEVVEEDTQLAETAEETTEQVEATAPETTEEVVETKPEDEALPPLDWKPAIQQNLYTDEEAAWLERAQDDPDPKIRMQANQFMMNKTVEYNNKAALVAQAQMASIPQQFMSIHGPVVAEYLNTYVKPERRGAPEALEEAQAWAVMQRAKQVGAAKAYREAANALDGVQQVKVQPPPTPKPAPVPKVVIPAESRVPAGGAGVVTERTVRPTNRGLDRIEKALGIPLD